MRRFLVVYHGTDSLQTRVQATNVRDSTTYLPLNKSCWSELLFWFSNRKRKAVKPACMAGALWAKQGERGILPETRDEGRRKNKAAVTSPLFWLFRPPTHTSIDWRRRCQKDQSKHDTLLENCHLSGYQKYRHQHKPQEIKTTRSWITCNNVRLSKAKVPFAQSKFSLCLSPRRERKGGKPVVQKNSKVMFH